MRRKAEMTEEEKQALEARSKRKSKINTWHPGPKSTYVSRNGKNFVVHFDKIYGMSKLKNYNSFPITKTSYQNQLDTIVRYTNFFIHFYDEEQELPNAYLKLRTVMDADDCPFGPDDKEAFIDFLYQIMFTPTMVEKIKRMVEENYLDDIESGPLDEKKKGYKANEKKHLESLEFTNQHIKILLAISFGMKILCPVMFYFCQNNGIVIDKKTLVIYNFYEKLFDIFNEDCNMFNKLYVYVKTKVLESNSNNAIMYDQRQIFGIDLYTVISQFTKVILISENMVKYKFNEHWNPKQRKYSENIIGFNKTIIKYQITYFLKEQYEKNLAELSNTKNNEGLSGIDKMAMHLDKYDEGSVLLADLNIDMTIRRIREMVDIPISDEEIDYQMRHMEFSDIQTEYIRAFYARHFGNYSDLALIPKRDMVILTLLMKKILLIDLGYDVESQSIKYAALPYILSGNLEDRIVNRMVRNSKFIESLENSYKYQRLVGEDYKMLQEIDGKNDFIKSRLSTIINTKFSYVAHEAPELLGKEILYDESQIADELCSFLEYI